MKIHFVGSLAGNKDNYRMIINTIKKLGYEVVTEHSISRVLDDIKDEEPEDSRNYVKKMMNWIKKSDIVIVEVTQPEVGSGYELALGLQNEKPVIAMYTDGKDPKVLVGQGEISEKVQVVEYDADDIREVLAMAIDMAKDQQDVRFNFFVSPKIVRFLDWISKKKKMPRAVYLRRLIEKDMEKNKEYQDEI
jgi:2'-deoxynucleoside 5'-phosphate N-hydrolase